MVPCLPLLSCESSVFVKENPKRKEKQNKKNPVGLYGTMLAELPSEEEYNYNILLRMTFEIFKEIFQLIKGNIPKENTNLRELIRPRL